MPQEPQKKGIAVEIKDADKGEVEAVFATFGVKDKDGDITLPGAFDDGAEVLISAYGHSSWGGQLPVGKGVIKTTEKDARLIGQFFLDTVAGREHFAVIKRLGSNQEWSYGFDVKGTGEVTPEMEQQGVYRVLTKLHVHEVSPVLLGAGVDTRTIGTKDAPADKAAEALPVHKDGGYSDAAWDGPAEEAAMDAAKLLVSCLAFMGGDPEAKTNYKLPYRDREGRVNSNAVRAIASRLAETELPAGIRSDVEKNAAALMEYVQSQEKERQDVEQKLAEAYRVADKLG